MGSRLHSNVLTLYNYNILMCHLCMSIKANQLYCSIPHSKFPCYMYLCSPQVYAKQCCKVITACLQVHVHAHMKEGPIHYTTRAHKKLEGRGRGSNFRFSSGY